MKEHDLLTRILNELDTNFLQPKSSLPVDVRQTKEGVEFHAYVPGIKREQINITVEPDNILTISVDSTEFSDKFKQDGWVRIESYSTGKSKRDFVLSSSVDLGSIKANLQDGILLVSFKYKEKAAPVKVDIE